MAAPKKVTEATGEETTTATLVKAVTKASARTDLFVSTTQKLEGMTKAKLLSYAEELATSIDTNYFTLGGALKKIHENGWFEPYATFEDYVAQVYGFQSRKARYLMDIYQQLTFHMIPWDTVKVLGWTKLKELAPILSVDNVDEWVNKAKDITVLELKAMLSGAGATETDGTSTSTVSDTKKMTFTLKNDQIDTVTTAIAKAKADANTEYDNVGLEHIAAHYLNGTSTAVSPMAVLEAMTDEQAKSVVQALLTKMGTDAALEVLGEAFPDLDMTVAV